MPRRSPEREWLPMVSGVGPNGAAAALTPMRREDCLGIAQCHQRGTGDHGDWKSSWEGVQRLRLEMCGTGGSAALCPRGLSPPHDTPSRHPLTTPPHDTPSRHPLTTPPHDTPSRHPLTTPPHDTRHGIPSQQPGPLQPILWAFRLTSCPKAVRGTGLVQQTITSDMHTDMQQ